MMSQTGQVTSYTKKLYPFECYHRLLSNQYSIEITKVYTIDETDQRSHLKQNEPTEASINHALAHNQSYCCEFTIGGRYQGGYRVSMTENNVYEITLWVDTNQIPHIKFESLNRAHLAYYDHVIAFVTEVIHKDDLILAGVGLDADLKYFDSNDKIIANSSGVFIWIASNVAKSCIGSNYQVGLKGNFVVCIRHI